MSRHEQYEINYGTIQPTGNRGKANRVMGIGRGVGKIVEIDNNTLRGEVYFEGHPDQMDENLGWDPTSMIVELYGGIDFGLAPCTQEGIMLGHRLVNMTGYDDIVTNFNFMVERFDDFNDVMKDDAIECHPRSTNGRLGKISFTLDDWFYYNEQSPSVMNLWYPFRTGIDAGDLEFCIHVEMIDPGYSSEDDDFDDDYFQKKNVTSWMDTKFKVEITAPDEENGYTRYQKESSEAKVYSNQPFGPSEGLTTYKPLRYNETEEEEKKDTEPPTPPPTQPPLQDIILPVKTFRCSSPDESNVPGVYSHSRAFRKGQTFRMCVGPSVNYEKTFQVIGFSSVVCKNRDRNTTIIDEFGQPDPLTIVDERIIGYTQEKGGVVTSNRTQSISSVITADLAGAFTGGRKYFTCNGIVHLESTFLQDAEEAAALVESQSERTMVPTFTDTGTSTGTEDSIGEALEKQGLSGDEEDYIYRYRPNSRALTTEWDVVPRSRKDQEVQRVPAIIGYLRFRVDITPPEKKEVETQVTGFVNKSVNAIKNWFTSSAPSTSVRSNYHIVALYGTSFLLPLIIFS